ncbi:hypothetical protein COLO4_04404 [Corchorus olitorius]|uniref:S-locus glycoprotein n=1 Tax=Corchorus olitorius TaxID=93759 RepID=A0A1R3KU50_9ROSI|nr:hypothetical protein COLO4_04404 [Corchorus olitorius]
MEKKKNPWLMLPLFFLCFCLESQISFGADTISFNQSLSGHGTIVSAGEIFELGFFRPGNSPNYYIGMWYKEASQPNTVWVANREKPVRDIYSSVLKIVDGNLVSFNESQIPIWSTNVRSTNSTSAVAVLLDDGNLILRDGPNSSTILWQSFDHPADTWLAGSKLSFNKQTNQSRRVTSWKSQDDPAPGFQPASQEEWNQQLYTGGCVRQAKLQCENASVGNERIDQFLESRMTTFPTNPLNVTADGIKDCESTCLKNCSCTAYAYDENNGCSIWIGDLLNLKQLDEDDNEGKTLYIRIASSPANKKKLIIVAVAVSSGLFLLGLITIFIIKIRRWRRTIITTNPTEVALQVTEGGDALNLLENRLNGNVNVEELSRICTVACWCIQDDEFQRPTMSQVVQILEGILELSQPPIPRFLQACIREYSG